MFESALDFLHSVKADDLEHIIEVDREMHNDSVPDYRNLLELVRESYPELLTFAAGIVDSLPGTADLSDDGRTHVALISVIGIGALCRAAELRELPVLPDLPDYTD